MKYKSLHKREITKVLSSTQGLSPLERQTQLENVMFDLGTAKFLSKVDVDNEADTSYTSRLLQDYTQRVHLLLQEELKVLRGNEKKRGVQPPLLILFDRKDSTILSELQIAYIASRYIIGCVRSEKVKVTSTVFNFTNILSDILGKDVHSQNTLFWIAYVLLEMVCRAIPESFNFSLGYMESSDKFKNYIITPTEHYVNLVEENIDTLSEACLITAPMLCTPEPWSLETKCGGFVTERYKKPLVKGNGFEGVSQEVVDEVNHIQSVPYRINKSMLTLIKHLNKVQPTTFQKAFYPVPVKIDPESKPDFDEEWEDLTEEKQNELRAFSIKCKAYRKQVDRRFSARVVLNNAIIQAELFKDEDKIWFPHDLCYRQRLYNMIMSGINTQGKDEQKALIEYADGDTIRTERGIYWMKVNLANFLGQDKLHVNDRVKWVDNNSDTIKHEVIERFTSTQWHSWDKPLQGMALAIEYVEWLENPLYEFRTWMQLDGKVNGSQNLAAITNNQQVGREVGLQNTGKECGDLYTLILEKVIEKVNNDSDADFKFEWNKSTLLVRNLTKTPVMTKGYDCSLYGVKDGVRELILEKEKASCFSNMVNKSNKMGDIIWESMEDSMQSLCQVMVWYKACAKIITSKGLPFKWTTPMGMECYHSPFKQKGKRIRLTLNGKRVRVQFNINTDEINPAKAQSSVSANITHSFDSSHLFKTNHRFRTQSRAPVKASYVHDSFGTNYDKVDDLLDCTKLAWIDIYDTNQLERLYQEWSEYLLLMGKNVKVPHYSEYIQTGSLDAKEVLDSDWFFG